ncbi:MAG: TldD/PmbA family protein [Erysipelotrichaceae bacterium]|nr:TldD/PmbA family protein [Erysipelotrichaceae bacterium]
MIAQKLAIEVLNAALATGGDYAEIYLENTISENVTLDNGKVDHSSRAQSYGCGIRILQGFNSVYGFTSDLSRKSLLTLAGQLSRRFEGERKISVKEAKNERIPVINRMHGPLTDVPVEEKINLLREASSITMGVDSRIVRCQVGFSDSHKDIEIWNTEGNVAHHYKNTEDHGRFFDEAIAKEGNRIESAFEGPGRCASWDWFVHTLDWRERAKKAGETAIRLLSAVECPQGKYTVVIANGWGGVVFHEACGHSLEATATARHLSVFSDSIGKQIASPIVSAYDDGTIPNEWGSNNIDSEGHATQKNQLIKDGICVGFLVDKFNGRRLGMEANGTSRRQNYQFEPTSRMSNTYIAAGKDNPEDILKDTKLGIYVTNFGGGSVEPITGKFNFSANEAYIIRDGKVCEMVKGCTLIGSGAEVLMNIDRVGNDVALGQGMCGSQSGSIPVNVGQPTIRIQNLTVGGRGGKLE